MAAKVLHSLHPSKPYSKLTSVHRQVVYAFIMYILFRTSIRWIGLALVMLYMLVEALRAFVRVRAVNRCRGYEGVCNNYHIHTRSVKAAGVSCSKVVGAHSTPDHTIIVTKEFVELKPATRMPAMIEASFSHVSADAARYKSSILGGGMGGTNRTSRARKLHAKFRGKVSSPMYLLERAAARASRLCTAVEKAAIWRKQSTRAAGKARLVRKPLAVKVLVGMVAVGCLFTVGRYLV